jgi:hypothetical protein
MLNPDISDSTWIAQRELLWSSIEDYWAEEGTRKMMKVLRRVFFTGWFDMQDKDCLWFIEHEPPMLDFVYYPSQTKEFWVRYFGDQCRARLEIAPSDKRRDCNPLIAAQRFLSFESDLSMYGWDIKTELELHDFFLGKEFVPGPQKLLGFESKINYLADANRVFIFWTEIIYRWLVCGTSLHASGPPEENKWLNLKSYFLSCLPHIEERYFGDLSWDPSAKDKNIIREFQELLHQMYHFNEEVRFQALIKKGASEELAGNMVSRRIEFLKELRRGMESLSKPALHVLLERAKAPGFKPDFSDKNYLKFVNTLDFIG